MNDRKTVDGTTIAVVGTGMAGLVTAWLLQDDPKGRYRVKVFESGDQTSLDSASVSVPDPYTGITDRVDIPMRAFTEGYYHNLKAMYDCLGIAYHVQPFLFSFARFLDSGEDGYFIHASNNHQLPPIRPYGMSIFAYLLELTFVLICHVWFNLACLRVPAIAVRGETCENFDQYLRRIWLPRYFIRYYLLPLMSAVTTCTHEELLRFPAKDMVDYKRCITSRRQLVVTGGVGKVQQKLLRGMDIEYSAKVERVEPCASGVKLSWTDPTRANTAHEEVFDKVVLAVPPNIVGSIFETVRKDMSSIPTTRVQTIVHRDKSAIPALASLQHRKAQRQIIHLRTSNKIDVSTEANHVQPSGVMVTSCPLRPVATSAFIQSSTFTRVLRTPESRTIVNRMFGLDRTRNHDTKDRLWMNGDAGVYLVGAWCWDGMVLLEGCVVSAVRTARALGVEAPWLRAGP